MQGYIQLGSSSANETHWYWSQVWPICGFVIALWVLSPLGMSSVALLHQSSLQFEHVAIEAESGVNNLAVTMRNGVYKGMHESGLHLETQHHVFRHRFTVGGQSLVLGTQYLPYKSKRGIAQHYGNHVATQAAARRFGDQPSDAVLPPDSNMSALELQLLQLAAATSRGTSRSIADAETIDKLVVRLEQHGPPKTVSNGALDGTWRLIYASCPVYRSSPFFWAFGQLVQEIAVPLFAITDGLPLYRVGAAWQTLRSTASTDGRLVSVIEVEVSIFDALVPPLRSSMTTTARARPDGSDPASLILELETTEVKKSQLPFSDALAFPIQSTFDGLRAGSSTVRLRTTYLSPTMRISRSPSCDVLLYVADNVIDDRG